MAQSTILAVGSTAATSTDVTILPGGAAVTVSIFATGPLPPQAVANLWLDTPGADILLGQLTSGAPTTVITGPGVYRVTRVEGPSFGVALEQ